MRATVRQLWLTLTLLLVLPASGAQASFGFQSGARALKVTALNSDGSTDVQAGSHPYEYTVSFAFKTTEAGGKTELEEQVRDVEVDLPPGLVGDPLAVPRCPREFFEALTPRCPADTQVGILRANIVGTGTVTIPVYNLVPPSGVPVSVGTSAVGLNAIENASLRTGEGYGAAVAADPVSSPGLESVEETIWGVPAAPSHTPERWCFVADSYQTGCASETEHEPNPVLTLPTSCTGPLETTVRADSTENPAVFVSQSALSLDAGGNPIGLSGCERLPFAPSLALAPETTAAESPTGLRVDLHIPQHDEEPEGLASADLKSTVVTLPEGVTVDPSEATGAQACPLLTGREPEKEAKEAAGELVGIDLESKQPAVCPSASKIGSVEVETPLIDHPLPGSVYLAAQGANPFSSLLAIYITVYDPITGVVVKLPGHIEVGGEENGGAGLAAGQVRTTVAETPQLPFEDFKLDFYGGPRAPLTTPSICGPNRTSAVLTPWTAPEGAEVSLSSSFQITSAANGGPCPASESQQPNAPAFQAGSAVPLAGSYSPFVLDLSREDGSQQFKALNVTLAPGLLGKIAGIEQCPAAAIASAQARNHAGEGILEQQSPSCPSASEIGSVTVGAGSGSPFYAHGRAYLAGPYGGAPFSIVIVTPAIAGPFDLGSVVVRSALFINPNTAQVTVKSDPIPASLDGIPLDIRSIAIDISRPQFTLNPTNCSSMSITGQLTSTLEQSAALSDAFEAVGCANLPFAPQVSATTQGKTSKLDGASFKLKIAYPTSGEANVAKLDLTIPKILPSRLTTLQKACTEAQFNANPAGCPPGSQIATATVHTPLLNSPLSGPAYLVSHGGAEFPDVELILQGENVELVVDSKTQIKRGVTYAHAETVPDAPFTSFEFDAPEGPDSLFAANANPCISEILMPSVITGQNGDSLSQDIPIEPEGCPDVLTVLSHKAKKHAITIRVVVPAAGKLTVSGKGIAKTAKASHRRETLVLTIHRTKSGKHKITLTFVPTKGHKLTKAFKS